MYNCAISSYRVGNGAVESTPFTTNCNRVKKGYACTIEPNHRKVFSNLDFKKFLVNNISNISVNLRTEAGGLVPFAGGGKVVLTLKFQKFSN